MKKNLKSIKFNLTEEMASELIKFNKLKKSLYEAKELYNLDKNSDLLLKIKQIENDMATSKENFIKKFRECNKKEIIEYLKTKDE